MFHLNTVWNWHKVMNNVGHGTKWVEMGSFLGVLEDSFLITQKSQRTSH